MFKIWQKNLLEKFEKFKFCSFEYEKQKVYQSIKLKFSIPNSWLIIVSDNKKLFKQNTK